MYNEEEPLEEVNKITTDPDFRDSFYKSKIKDHGQD